jgi:GWxTD domain-containing protein
MNEHKQINLVWFTAFLLLTLLFFSYCGNTKSSIIEQLPPDDQDFIRYVRYIITKSERNTFLSLASATDRAQFRHQFWKKRDPDPTTQLNEFKRRYFNRIEEANTFFSRGSVQGWTTDRGRVYVLLGPPETKRIYPTGYRIGSYPSEVWIYGFYPVIFIDRTQSGNYELNSLGAWHLGELVKLVKRDIPKVAKVQNPFGFSLKLFKDKQHNRHNLRIAIPYRNIVFQEDEQGFKADLIINVSIIEIKKQAPQSMKKEHTIRVNPKDLEQLGKEYLFNIPLKLEPGKYETEVIIENKADKIQKRDKIQFKI